jgi:Xaa-Pro aminopeptidase
MQELHSSGLRDANYAILMDERMFQNFHETADKTKGPERLKRLRDEMNKMSLTHFLVPHGDEHQNEYLPPRAERLQWLTGFSGSAGFAIAGLETCAVFVDGRYTLQVRDQVDLQAFTPASLIDTPPATWIKHNTNAENVIGFDPWLTTMSALDSYQKSVAISGANLKPVENPLDKVWSDQPPKPLGNVFRHPDTFAGKPSADKIASIQKTLKKATADLCVLTDPASLAWLFNIRGSDVVHNPLPLGFAILSATKNPVLFIEDSKLSDDVKAYLDTITEDILDPKDLVSELSKRASGKSIMCDPARTPVALSQAITNADGKIIKDKDPVILPRAIKNTTELEGTRTAHIRDGVAMCKFLFWLDQQKPETLDEISAAKKLEECRHKNAKEMGSKLLEISFDTISGFGPNGAIVHYRVNENSNKSFKDGSLYLCDSGGQYVDGTTDITRTIAIGTPPSNAALDFTLVLKGHIALATAHFPKGTRGVDIDVLARRPLWSHGKDYAHGTGHGVGSYLNVHEGPQSISKRGMEPLLPGMIISNEPGFYVEEQYGIRIENLVIVKEAENIAHGNIETHCFETITLCPIDRRLIIADMLSSEEREWLNAYHHRVQKTLAPHLKNEESTWLSDATKPI